MVEALVDDLLSLDRDVALGWKSLTQWRGTLAKDLETQAQVEPLESVRHVAGKSTWDALDNLVTVEGDLPLRDALKRWVFSLTLSRVALPFEVKWAQAASDRRGIPLAESVRQVSWLEAWRGLAAARTAEEAQLLLEAAAAAASPVADATRQRAERRLEAARRFGVDHPWTPIAPVERGALRCAAERLLDRTDDLSAMVWNRALSDARGPSAVLHAAMARDAGEGWPAHVTAHWLADVFGQGTRGLDVELPSLPAAFGASSFARALVGFGFAARLAMAPSSMPFALARDPAFVGAHRLGFVFGALAFEAQWQEQTLGIGRRTARGQSIILARSALLETRLHAARLLLGDDAAFAPPDRFEELGARLFGRSLDPRLRGAWPAARDDEPARIFALLESLPLAEALRERFDVDWYRNPRAWDHLHGLGAVPAHESADGSALAHQVDAVVRAFERALG